ncbi:MAG TPA: SLC13 family permease [Thermoanaerobaculia bacterium]|nr:SLC13 family permease [Thermoanaerobaculia bacterium]
MTFPILILLLLLAAAVVLFATEAVPVDVAGVLLLLGLFFTGLVDARELFRGFGSEVVLFLASLFVISEALVRSGALDLVEVLLVRLAERHPRYLLAVLLPGTAVVSAFLSNTATMAALLPLVMSLSRRLRHAPSKLLMPVAFASILGGAMTLIGTSTNVVVSGLLPRFGQPRLGLFELAPVALPAAALGVIYLLTVGRRLLPDRGGEPLDAYRMREYLTEVAVPEGSAWVGKSLRQLGREKRLEVTVLGGIDGEGSVRPLGADEPLTPEARLLVKADQDALLRLKKSRDVDLEAERSPDAAPSLPSIHELVLPHGSRLARRTLREMQFGARYRVIVLALYRRGEPVLRRLPDIRLRDGDVLLVQGEVGRLEWLLREGDLLLLEERPVPPRGPRAWIAAGLFFAMLLVGGLGLAPFPVAALATAALLILARVVGSAEAYAAVDWRVLVMIGSLLALATAMETSGAAAYLAAQLVGASGAFGPLALLAGFYLLTMLLTQPMSNQAAALVVLPLAIRAAETLDLNPRTFAVTVALAASSSFITPLEPASLLAFGPGRYRFADFFRVGLPLTVLVLAVTLLLVPRVWPLAG